MSTLPAGLRSLKQHSVVSLGSIAYYLRNRVECTLPSHNISWGKTVPAVVLNAPQNRSLDVAYFENTFARFEATDDVFTSNFAFGGVYVAQTTGHESATPAFSDDVHEFLRNRSATLIFTNPSNEASALPEGPYILQGQELHQAWRLYQDESDAFVVGIVPADEETDYKFQPLQANVYSGLHRAIAVPSRLYFPPSEQKRLNGVRISIKDNFHLNGVVSGLGSRSYSACYGPQNITSRCVQKLVDQGAVIVGKTVMAAFAGSEVPPEKCIDYFPPWNPRADGYQGPSGSSSGAASSIASYEWLDIALGTDTTGSIRMPAASYGLWGFRATWNHFPLEGVQPSVRNFDSLGILCRSPETLHRIYSAFPGHEESPQKPTKILYPIDWFPFSNPAQQKMYEEFLSALEEYLGVKHTRISLKDEWERTGPEHLRDVSLSKYLHMSVHWPNLYDGLHNYDKFQEDYKSKFGKPVYTSPFMTDRWERGSVITKAEREQGLDEIQVFKQWVDSKIMVPEESGLCTTGTIMLMPLGRPGANYRDIVPPQGKPIQIYSGYDEDFFSSILGLPQIVVPIGQNPFESRVSQCTEFAPIVGSLTGVKGSDMQLLSVVEGALRNAGWPTRILTGRNTFHVGENNRHSSTDVEVVSKL